jgi:gluconate 5-dehydrogenase
MAQRTPTSGTAQAIAKDALRGKTTLVTGASRGIGLAIATAFAQAGACSIFVVRDRAVGEKLVAELSARGLKADSGIADVSEPAQVSMLVIDIGQRHPSIDVLVNNAGILMDEDETMRPSL